GRQADALAGAAGPAHPLGEYATAAADIEGRLAREARNTVDPGQAQRVDLVQRLELALRVPPAVRERAEFREFLRIGVHASHILTPEIKKPRRSGAFQRRLPTTS